jgi:hypothetical protein
VNVLREGAFTKSFGKIACVLLLAPLAAAQAPLPDNKMAVPDDYRQWVFLTSGLDLNYNTAAEPGHPLDLNLPLAMGPDGKDNSSKALVVWA